MLHFQYRGNADLQLDLDLDLKVRECGISHAQRELLTGESF